MIVLYITFSCIENSPNPGRPDAFFTIGSWYRRVIWLSGFGVMKCRARGMVVRLERSSSVNGVL